MSKREWVRTIQSMRAWWPQATLPDSTLAQYFADLEDLPGAQVFAAVQVWQRDGHDWPPKSGDIRQRISELSVDAPTFEQAFRLARVAVARFGSYDISGALDWLDGEDALVGKWVRAIGFREFCMAEEGDTTFKAQCRRAWENVALRAVRDLTYVGIDPAGLPALERAANRVKGPRQLDGAVAEIVEHATGGGVQ